MVEEEIVTAVKEEDGILQSEVWKKFDIDSKKASRVVREMEEKGLILRESVVANGSRTYMLKQNDRDSPLDGLFSGESLSPCIDCSMECRPSVCDPLAEWAVAD